MDIESHDPLDILQMSSDAQPEQKTKKRKAKKQIEAGGSMAAFSATSFAAAMSTTSSYKAGGNLWWVNVLYNASPGTPLSAQRINMFREYYFSDGNKKIPIDIVVAVPSSDFKVISQTSMKLREVNIAYIKSWGYSMLGQQWR